MKLPLFSPHLNHITLSAVVLLVLLLPVCPGVGDEILIGDASEGSVSIGQDVECSTCDESANAAIELLTSDSNGEVTAGQLWKFFKAQGVESVDELTLRLDMDPGGFLSEDGVSSFDLDSLQVQIEDPQQGGGLLTDVSIGSSRLVFPSAGSSPSTSEMQLAVKLKYDFMKRFSADSTEKVKLNVSSASPGIFPSISIASQDGALHGVNLVTLMSFVGFWFAVFGFVNWMTKPNESVLRAMQTSAETPLLTAKKQIVSI